MRLNSTQIGRKAAKVPKMDILVGYNSGPSLPVLSAFDIDFEVLRTAESTCLFFDTTFDLKRFRSIFTIGTCNMIAFYHDNNRCKDILL